MLLADWIGKFNA
jgi:Ca2+-binding EF-hand superfamily protein